MRRGEPLGQLSRSRATMVRNLRMMNSHISVIKEGIKYEFSAAKTPQSNDVVERKSKTIQEMARVLLNRRTFLINSRLKLSIQLYTRMTYYDMWKGKKPNVKHFHIFGSLCYILKYKENQGKWSSKSDERIFLCYSETSKACQVYKKKKKNSEGNGII